MNFGEGIWYFPAAFTLCFWPSMLFKCQRLLLAGRKKWDRGKKELVPKGRRDWMTWDPLFTHRHSQLAGGLDIGQNHTELQ